MGDGQEFAEVLESGSTATEQLESRELGIGLDLALLTGHGGSSNFSPLPVTNILQILTSTVFTLFVFSSFSLHSRKTVAGSIPL